MTPTKADDSSNCIASEREVEDEGEVARQWSGDSNIGSANDGGTGGGSGNKGSTNEGRRLQSGGGRQHGRWFQ